MKIFIQTLFLTLVVSFSLKAQVIGVAPVIDGDLLACAGGESTYVISNFEDTWTINWQLTGGGTIIEETDSEITILWDALAVGSSYMIIAVRTDDQTAAMATFTVTGGNSIPLICRGHLNVSLEADCTIDLTSDMFIISSAAEASLLNVVVTDMFGRPIDEINSTHIGQTLTVSIEEPSSCGTNSCWTTITVEDKRPLQITCPPDTMIRCDLNTSPDSLGMPDIIECQPYTLEIQDYIKDGGCDGDTIFRTFRAIDANGKSTSCVQTIHLIPLNLDDLTLPDNFTCTSTTGTGANCLPIDYEYGTADAVDAISCDEVGTVYNTLENGYPSPYPLINDKGDTLKLGTGYPGGAFSCGNFNTSYEDYIVDVCNEEGCKSTLPSYKVIRTWTILEWCTGTLIEHPQIIKVIDQEAPMFDTLPDVTISTGLWQCDATYPLPAGKVTDNCSEDIHVTYGSSEGTITNNILYLPANAKTMEGEEVEIYVTYADCCGNQSIDTFLVTVADLVPPVVVADEHTVVSLSEYNNDGLAKIYAETFDDGSFDNCSKVDFSVRRMDTTCPGFSEEDGNDDSKPGDENLWFDFVHFCCEDIQQDENGNNIPVMVIFRVCDDANMNGIPGDDLGGDLCNTAMIEVEVQDKLAPACALPQDMTINCINFAAYMDLVDAGPLGPTDAARVDAAFGPAQGAATCQPKIVQELTSTEDCGVGKITRKVTVTNEYNGKKTSCTQIIDVQADRNTNFLTCNDIYFPEGSEEDKIYTAYIKKNYNSSHPAWEDRVWCLMNPLLIDDLVTDGEDLPAIVVDDCSEVTITTPEVNIDNLCSEVGINLTLDTFNFAGGGCKKILAHWEIIDQCIFVENYSYEYNGKIEINPFVAENGYFELYVEYDLFDTEGPEITCGQGENVGCGGSFNTSITATAIDNCSEPEFFGWSWEFDVDNNGTIDKKGEGNSIPPSALGLTSFPEGTHSVTWFVTDGCGNVSSEKCIFNLAETDTKAPTPYCYDGLSSAVMMNNEVTMWATDFDAGSFDNCSGVLVTMVPEVDVEGLTDVEAYLKSFNKIINPATGEEEYGWTFDCKYIENGVSGTIEVRIYAIDDSGNFDYCVSSFTLRDNLGACDDAGSLVAIGGGISTEDGKAVDGVKVEAMTNSPEFPKYSTSDDTGFYTFNNLNGGRSYEITSEKNSDYMNGVSTLDLVMIQRHIINVSRIPSPYKLVAADVNNDSKISAADLLQLRKLILGLYNQDKLPNNDSWRFIDSDYNFMDNENPWPLKEMINVNFPENDMMTGDFVAVKVGDVNGSVVLKGDDNAKVRNAETLIMNVDEKSFEAGEKVAVAFRASEFKNIFGYQFTLEFDQNLTFAGYESGAIQLSDFNFGLQRIEDRMITTSVDYAEGISVEDDEILFTIYFDANNASNLSSSIVLSSRLTNAETYKTEALEVSDINVNFRNAEGQVIPAFRLYQNEPNPFSEVTTIGFELPESGEATVSIYSVDGKVLYNKTNSYNKGKNIVSINAEELSAKGIVYYKVTFGDQFLTKKMVVIE